MPNKAIRNEYAKIGVDKFYHLHSCDYGNPHEEIIKKILYIAQEKGILLPMVLWRLSEIANTLIIISPNKKPDCDHISGWFLVDEVLVDRVRMKVYFC